MRNGLSLILFIGLFFTAPALADQHEGDIADHFTAPGPHVDAPPEMMQFGQLVGAWRETYTGIGRDGNPTGRNIKGIRRVTWTLNGMALSSYFTPDAAAGEDGPSNPVSGSIRIYDQREQKWKATWMNPVSSGFVVLEGGQSEAGLAMTGRVSADILVRWTFTDVQDDLFHWVGERSNDNGETWRVVGRVESHRIE